VALNQHGIIPFLHGNGNVNHQLGTGFWYIRAISAVMTAEFVSDRIMNVIQRVTGVTT
jgi:hypothetical protein